MHSFDPRIAAKVGVNAAVLYQNIVWWCEKNAANNNNEHDGRHWTYNSVKAWSALFPYMSQKQIRTALDRLEAEGLVLSGIYNKMGKDRTKWYAANVDAICPTGQKDLPLRADAFAPEGKPLPDSKPDTKPTQKETRIPEDAVISEKQIQIAAKHGHDEIEAKAQFDRFKSAAIAKGRRYANWDAAWNNWFTSPYFKIITGGRYDNRNHHNAGTSQGRQNRPDPALEQIARLAGIGTTPGYGGR